MPGETLALVIGGALVAGVVTIISRRRRHVGTQRRPGAADTLFALSLPVEQEALTRRLVKRLAPGGSLPAARARDAALELIRALTDATHAFAGPVPVGMPPTAIGRLPAGAGGVILALRVHTTRRLLDGSSAGDAAAMTEALRALAALDERAIGEAWLALGPSPSDGPELAPLRLAGRPGHRACAYCGASMRVSEVRCHACGARLEG